ncbi:MAG: hypothetical protein DWQ07_22405 [Chloroflexi bacterium]|nr:MAG: hypothetical protein DWQ07_22405 [Chloroflexota bacterium]MBL1193901.1 hypothetical protein [Chloroflexota bacterium]NOH11195.1 hypothetical protein [Chloroflexota bacterium]
MPRRTIAFVAGSLVLVLLLVGGVYIFFNYTQYAQQAGQLPPVSDLSQVSISSPTNREVIPLEAGAQISGIATGPAPFSSVELWVNGDLTGVYASQAQTTPLPVYFLWYPQEEGTFALNLRATNASGEISVSPTVLVQVQEQSDQPPSQPEEGAIPTGGADTPVDKPVSVPAAGGYVPPTGPQADEQVGEAENWNTSLAEWASQGNTDQIPAAPEIVVSALTCGANLSIHDLSENEQGFKVYRYLPAVQSWIAVATLDGQSQNAWISYDDSPIAGGVQYYVAAFNAAGSASSNIATINIEDEDCDTQLSDTPHLQIQYGQLIVAEDVQQAYCYRSFDGEDWHRWPLTGFFPEGEGGFDLSDHMTDIPLVTIDGEEIQSAVELHLNCWGWQGSEVMELGSLMLPDLEGQQGVMQVNEGLLTLMADVSLLDSMEFMPMNLGDGTLFPYWPEADVGGILGDIIELKPYMFTSHPYVTYDPDDCMAHLMPSAQNTVGKLLFCFPYPGFDAGVNGANPQPYLVWDYGVNNSGAFAYDFLLEHAAQNNATVGFIIYDNSASALLEWEITTANLFNFVIPPNGCVSGRSFFVQIYYERQDGYRIKGPVSSDATINCPVPYQGPSPSGKVVLEVTWETLDVMYVDDGESQHPNDVEVYGYFNVIHPNSSGAVNNFLNIGTWNQQGLDCPDEAFTFGSLDTFGTGNLYNCPQRFQGTTHGREGLVESIAEIGLCRSIYHHSCWSYSLQSGFGYPGWHENNNSVKVEVGNYEPLFFTVELWDYDDGSANDLVCINAAYLPGRSTLEWANTDEMLILPGTYASDESCQVTLTVDAIP